MTSTSDDDDLTCDAFLGGRVSAWQPAKGYRAGVDPVLLAASVPATEGQTVLELGCGVGVAALCLAWRTGAQVTGLEVQPLYADLARRNGVAVVEGDLTVMPATLRAQSFDHVMANPPYFDRRAGTPSRDPGRDIAMGEDAPLVAWVDAAVRRLKPKGTLTLIHRVERLPDMLAACDSRLGKLTLLPIAARQGQVAERVILRAEKGAKAPFRLMPPLVMHVGDRHTRDGDDYTARISAVLRNGASLEAAFSTAS